MSTVTAIATIAAVAATAAAPVEAPAAEDKGKKARKSISQDIEERILANFRQLHHITLLACTEVGKKPLFNDKFDDCNNEDYKNLHEQARLVIRDAVKVRWENYSDTLAPALKAIVDAHMATAREDKAEWDKLPARMQARCPWSPIVQVSATALKGAFPKGKTDTDIVMELNKLFPGQVGNGGKGKDSKLEDFHVNFAFVPAPAPTPAVEVAPAADAAPVSAEAPKDLSAAAE